MKTVNRIVTPILSLLILPVTFLLPLFRIVISSGLMNSGDNKVNLLDNFGLSEFISIKDIILLAGDTEENSMNLFKLIWDALAGEKKQEIIDMLPGLHWGVVFLVFLVLTVLFAILLAVFAAVSKKSRYTVCFSVAGIVSALIMNASFDAFAKPFLNGAFNLNTILGNTNQLLSVLLGNVASFDYMKLGIAYTAMLLIFMCALILGVASYVEQKNGGK